MNFLNSKYNILCKLCKSEKAIVEVPSQKIKLCKNCYNQFFENRVKKCIEKYKMFHPDNKIGIFLSGGKDSATLLAVLKKLYPNINIQGIYINLGIRYYSDITENTVKELCKKVNVPLYVYSLYEKEGYRIDDFIFTRFKHKICSACGAIKRYLFSKIAKELNLDVIATGHHLDDTVSTMLSLFFQGDFDSIVRLSPVLPPIYPGQVKKVKPLYTTPEKEILYYSLINELPVEKSTCPHKDYSSSEKYKKILDELEKENRQIKYQLLSVFSKKLIPLIKRTQKKEEILEIKKCIKCGEITSSPDQICSRCKRIELLNQITDKTLELSSEEFLDLIKSLEPDEWVIFDIRNKDEYEKRSFNNAKWISPEILDKSNRRIYKTFKPFKTKRIFIYGESEKLSYLLVLKLRKLGFRAFNIKHPKHLLQKNNFVSEK